MNDSIMQSTGAQVDVNQVERTLVKDQYPSIAKLKNLSELNQINVHLKKEDDYATP